MMAEEIETDLRVRVPESLKKRFVATLNARKVSQTTGVAQLMEFLIQADQRVQLLILGQVSGETRDEILLQVLENLATRSTSDAPKPTLPAGKAGELAQGAIDAVRDRLKAGKPPR